MGTPYNVAVGMSSQEVSLLNRVSILELNPPNLNASNYSRNIRIIGQPLTGGVDTAGGILALANLETVASTIIRIFVLVSTVATAACTLDIGLAANGTTLNDTLIDGLDVHTGPAPIWFDTETGASVLGTNGVLLQPWAANKVLTVSTASGASAGLAGAIYVCYFMQ